MGFWDFFRRKKNRTGESAWQPALPDHQAENAGEDLKTGKADAAAESGVSIENAGGSVSIEPNTEKPAEQAASRTDQIGDFIDTNVVNGEVIEVREVEIDTDKKIRAAEEGKDAAAAEDTKVTEAEAEDKKSAAAAGNAAKAAAAGAKEAKVTAAEAAGTSGTTAEQVKEKLARMEQVLDSLEKAEKNAAKSSKRNSVYELQKDTEMSKEKKSKKAAEKDRSDKDTKKDLKKDSKKAAKKEAKKENGKESAQETGKEQKSLYEWNRPKKKEPKPEPVQKLSVTVGNIVIGEGLTKICVPVMGADLEALSAEAEMAVKAAPDLVEWRVDFFADILDEEKAGAAAEKLQSILGIIPILFTFRTADEGGNRPIEADDYRRLLNWAAKRPEIAAVDIEGQYAYADTELLVREVREQKKPVIASAHYFDKTPKKAELEAIFDRLERTGADILKLAVMPEKPKDVLRLMTVTAEKNETTTCPLITMAMGDLGKISRISGSLTGSALTFGTVGQASAPGQLPVSVLREIVEVV